MDMFPHGEIGTVLAVNIPNPVKIKVFVFLGAILKNA
jgi:hypothetical protein